MSNKSSGASDRARLGLIDVLIAAIAPGLPTMRRRRVHGAVLLLFGVVGPIVWLAVTVFRHGSWIELGLDRTFLGQLILVIAIAVITRLAGVGEVLAASSATGRNRLRGVVAFAALLAVTVPSAVGVAAAAEARSDIDRAFGDATEDPIFDAAVPSTTDVLQSSTTVAAAPPSTASTAPPTTLHPSRVVPHELVPEPDPRKPRRPDAGVDPALLDDITTILLIGGDAGPGRSGLRTDSMILVSIHRPSGRTALISVPRNLERILFPPGSALEARYPYGFTEIANAVYPIVSANEELRDAYRLDGLRPGAVATAQTLGYSLDVTIDDYVLVDMQGFLEVVDAMGGVTVDVRKAVPTPGNPPGAKHPVPDVIPAGTQHMDGTTALAYVRSRKADSDYQRMRRQRDVLGALATQVTLSDALGGYTAVTSALGDSLHTSLSTDEFANFIDLLGAQTSIVESVGLSPPLVDPSSPNYGEMAKIVGRVQLALVAGEPSGY
jgi:polyisoprenyl-teichoic acid--peptidoglycan teichoic acid transferase